MASPSRSTCVKTSPSVHVAPSISRTRIASRGSSSTSRTRVGEGCPVPSSPNDNENPRLVIPTRQYRANARHIAEILPTRQQIILLKFGVSASDGGSDAVPAMRGGLIPVPRTLRARLVAAATVSILAAVALFGAAAVTLVNRELRDALDRALRQRAQEVAQLAVSAPSVLTGPGALESPVSGRQIAVEVVDAHGRILARSEALGARLLPQDALARQALLAGRTGFEDIRSGGRPFRLYAAPIADAGGSAAGGAVLVASDTSDIPDTIGRLGFVLVLSGAVVALLAALAAAVLTRRSLRPLSRLVDAAGEIERTADPTRRLPAA